MSINKSTFNPLEVAAVFNDQNSAVRNSTTALRSFTSLPAIAATAINGSATAGGLAGLYIGSNLMHGGYKKTQAAYSYGDKEGMALGALWGAAGAGYTGLSGVMTSEGIMGLAGTTAPLAMASALSGLGLGMNVALGVYGGYALNEARKFGNELDQKSDAEALSWLESQVTLSPEEKEGKSPKEITQLLQKKWNQLELRVGADCKKTVQGKLHWLVKSDDIEAKKTFVQEVKKANFKQQVKFALFILLAIVGTAALIAGIVSTGPASPIIFALGALLWLTVDSSKLHSYIGDKCWKWHCESQKLEPTCEKTHLISQKTIS